MKPGQADTMKNLHPLSMLTLAVMAALWSPNGRGESYFNPAFLSEDTASVADLSRFERSGTHLKVTNASPYYVTLVNLQLGGQRINNLMIAPKNSAQQTIPASASGTLSWQSVNDYGAITPVHRVNL